MSWKLEIWQNKHIAAEKEQTADTKRSFSLANTIQSTTTEPRKTPRCPKRTPNSTRFEQEHSSPFAQESSTRLSGQTQNARRKKKMRNCLTHRELSERKHNMANWQMTNYTFVSFFSFFFLMVFFHFVVSTMKLHALAGRSKKEQVVVNGEVRCATCKDCHPNSTPPYLHISPPGTWSHLTLTTPHSLSHLELGACQGQSCNCSLVVECPLTPLFHLLSPEPLSLRIGQSCWHHPVQWCDTYALSGWSLFTCQCTRVSCYGRNDGHEARRQEGEHTDSHNTNSTLALSSPYLCTINFFLRDEQYCTLMVRWAIREVNRGCRYGGCASIRPWKIQHSHAHTHASLQAAHADQPFQ